ncbi:MAG: hypothetical protein H6738_18700 [Alphaproteobacteria bacterium]|nr:hypothetical protein [Alphaproteobacteria bacterium]
MRIHPALVALVTTTLGCTDRVVASGDVALEPVSSEPGAPWVARMTWDDGIAHPGTELRLLRSHLPCSFGCATDDLEVVNAVQVQAGDTETTLGPVLLPGGFRYVATVWLVDEVDGLSWYGTNSAEARTPVQPIEHPDALVGTTFASRGDTFVVDGVFAGLQEVLHTVWLPTLTIDAVVGDRVSATLAYTEPTIDDRPTQRVCTSTTSLTGRLANPEVTFDPTDLTVVTGMGSTRVYGTVVTAQVLDEGRMLGDVRFSGSFDLRDLVDELGGDLADVCGTGDANQCEPCPDGEQACAWVDAHHVVAEPWDVRIERGSDACGIEGDLARWDFENELIYTAERGSDLVRALAFDGSEVWRAEVGGAVDMLVYSDGDLLPVEAGPDGYTWWRLARATGAESEERSGDDLPEDAAVGDIAVAGYFASLLFFLWGGVPMPGCSISALMVGAVPTGALWMSMAAALGRRRSRSPAAR